MGDVVQWCHDPLPPAISYMRSWNTHVHWDFSRTTISMRIRDAKKRPLWHGHRDLLADDFSGQWVSMKAIQQEMMLDVLRSVPVMARRLFKLDTRVDVATGRRIGAEKV